MRKWIAPPSFDNDEKARRAELLNAILLISITACLVYGSVSYLLGRLTAFSALLLGCAFCACLAAQGLMRKGYIRSAVSSFIIPVWFVITLAILFSGGMNSPSLAAYLVVISMAGLLLGLRGGLIVLLGCFSMSGIMVWLASTGRLPAPIVSYTHLATWVLNTVIICLVFFMLSLSIRGFRDALGKAREELKERKKIEEALRQNEALFRSLTENATDILTIIDRNVQIRYASPGIERILGISLEKTLQDKPLDYVHPDDLPVVVQALKDLLENHHTTKGAELRVRHQDGTWRYLEVIGKNQLDDPVLAGIVVSIHDITERKKGEKALLNAEERYRSLVEEVPAIVYTAGFGRTAKWEYVSPQIERILGFSPQEWMADPELWYKRLHPQDRDQALQTELHSSQTGEPFQCEYRLIGKDGRVAWFLDQAIVFRDPSGIPTVLQGIMYDITDRKIMEEALRVSEERYMLVATGANDGLWDWDIKTNSIYFSPRWKEMFGYKDDEIRNNMTEWLERVHPDDLEKVERTILPGLNTTSQNFNVEYRIRHKDGTYHWALNRGVVLRDADGVAYRLAGSLTDITDRKKAEAQLLFGAFHDLLTGLSNRAFLIERLTHVINYGERDPDYRFAVLFLDLDDFKVVNDTFGHGVGDKLLIEVAKRLGSQLRSIDTFARLGGDEFVVLLEHVKDIHEVLHVAERVQTQLMDVFDLHGLRISTSASIGIVWNEIGYKSPEEVLRDADIAMYRAKGSGKARYQVFTADMREQMALQIERETNIRRALERDEFFVMYQPIYSLQSRKPIGLEALLRWKHPTQGLLLPGEFMRIAESSNLIIPIDRFVLREACRSFREWARAIPEGVPLDIHINLSSKHFVQHNFIDTIKRIIQDAKIDPRRTTLEITESVIMENVELASKTIGKLHDLGIQIGIDDFGTGFSSLSYLTHLPVDVLKIDRSFIQRFLTDKNTREIVYSVLQLANKLSMKVVAEGIETDQQLASLIDLGCKYGQGFLFSKPLEKEAIPALLAAHF